jgi:anti-sigma B factor antagonist
LKVLCNPPIARLARFLTCFNLHSQGTLVGKTKQPRRLPCTSNYPTATNSGILVVDCVGRIVFGDETGYLRDTVKQMLLENKRIVLNLGEISYIDSGGLGTLVALYTSATSAGASIKLANLTKRVGDLLQVTKLLTVFEVYDSEEKALEAFGKAAA